MRVAYWLPLCLAFALPASASCKWQDDGDLANALSGSEWIISTSARLDARGNSVRLDQTSPPADLIIGPLLKNTTLNGDPLELVLKGTPLPEKFGFELGRDKFVMARPDNSQWPCVGKDLSMLHGSGVTRIERRHAKLNMELWPASDTRLVGFLRIERIDAFNQPHARYETIEATPKP